MKYPSRRPEVALAAVVLAVSLAGCAEPAAPKLRSASPPRFTALDSSTKTLYVAIMGVNRVYSEGYYTFKANVQGTSSSNLHYDWLQQYCYNDFEYCSDFALIQSSVGVDSISIEYPANIGKMRLALEVWDDQTAPWSGEATKTIIGPSPVYYTNPTFGCQFEDTLYYPIKDFDGRYYRRDGCTGERVYQP